MRNSEHLALITSRDDILLLQTLRWPDELNSSAEAAPRGSVSISDNELRLADTLIDALGEADLSEYHDEYAQAVQALVTAKLEGEEPPAPSGERGGGEVVDLMAALQASVDQARPRGGRSGTKKAPARKTAQSSKSAGTAGSAGSARSAKSASSGKSASAAKSSSSGKKAAKSPARKSTRRKAS
jgi:DNA end-binding protein Ku